ncbi:MAG: hypothetical protein A2Y62_11815 [Candidatus Fischerbacteria bacterium RBG_13_37_8]|uniref:Tyr recombinase domain-containing protein n=1 Tax=Candidatus Fischerbacteria bacterium RBG_13_37_8 TaxID=1817863 RepID=A0A1F5VUS2_9BACT|nr:MAG: hypothetical protein A2Y62_11815 [Candidatus Fischerbacteria bacterium RBG_13_37_8]
MIFVLLTSVVLKPINDYLAARGSVKDEEPLFISLRHRATGDRLTIRTISYFVKTLLRSIGLNTPRLSAHSCRHTCITMALNAGATLQEVQAMARHKSITTTQIYAHNIDRIANSAERKLDNYLVL